MTSVRSLTATLVLAGATLAATVPTGPAVGQKALDFDLKDQKGAQRTLASVMGPKGALLVFYRSSDW